MRHIPASVGASRWLARRIITRGRKCAFAGDTQCRPYTHTQPAACVGATSARPAETHAIALGRPRGRANGSPLPMSHDGAGGRHTVSPLHPSSRPHVSARPTRPAETPAIALGRPGGRATGSPLPMLDDGLGGRHTVSPLHPHQAGRLCLRGLRDPPKRTRSRWADHAGEPPARPYRCWTTALAGDTQCRPYTRTKPAACVAPTPRQPASNACVLGHIMLSCPKASNSQ